MVDIDTVDEKECATDTANTARLSIGSRIIPRTPMLDADDYFNGKIDEVRMYDRLLNSSNSHYPE